MYRSNSLTTHTEQLNAARGRLRTVLYRDLYAPVGAMLADEKNHCQYKEKVMWVYLKALQQTEVWPSERVSHGHSIEEIIKKLEDNFICSDSHPGGTKSCFRCKGNFAIGVKKAIESTRGYFDGLCLGELIYDSSAVNTAIVLHRLYLHLEDGRQG